jgi:hypothetical protein
MSLRRVVPALLLLVLALAMAVPAGADVRVRIVRLSYLDGDVQIDRRDGQGFEHAMMNMPVVQGTRLWARDEGLVEIELEDGSTIRLTPNTLLEAQELALRSGRPVNLFDMQEGTAYFDLHGDDDDNFLLALPGHQLRLRKGSRFRVTAERNEVRVAVFKGEVVLSGSAVSHVVVKKGESITLDPFEDGRYFLSRDIRSEYYDTWDDERDEYRRTYARHNSYSGYSNVYYGASDLHYWGNYNYVPGWGWMWRPYYVGAGWNPWRDGAWVWYPGWGYTWVSAYPWGWMPYHYGSWVWLPTHGGWCWRPGGWNWRHNTVAYRAPGGFAVPLPPHRGGGRVVVIGDGGKTHYPRGDRGFFSAVRAAKEGASGGSRPLMGGSKGADPGAGSGLTSGSKSSDSAGGGRRSVIDGGTADTRGGRSADRDGAYKPRPGRTVIDSRGEPDDAGGREADTRGGRSGGDTNGRGTPQWTPRAGRETTNGGEVSNGGRSGDADSGSSGRRGDPSGGRSTSGGQQESPARVSPPPPAPPERQAAPPPPRSSPPPREAAPPRESPSRSTPSMSFSGGRSSGGGSRMSGPSSSGSSRSSGPSSSGRGSSGRSGRIR